MDEFWIGDNLVTFDGRIVELFGHPATPSARYHIANLDLTLSEPDRKGRRTLALKAATKRSGAIMLEIPPEDLPTVEPALDAILAAVPS